MYRGEQIIQKIRTKTEYRQAEALARQRLKEAKLKTDIRLESSELPTEDLPRDRQSLSSASSSKIDFQIESNHWCTPENNKIKIHRKLPDLINLNTIKNSPLTSNLLLNTSSIPLIHNNTLKTYGIHGRRSLVGWTPRTLPPRPSMSQPTPIRPIGLNTENLNGNKRGLQTRTPRRLPETQIHPNQNAFTYIVLTNQSSANHTSYRNDAQRGLHKLLQGNKVSDIISYYCLDKIS